MLKPGSRTTSIFKVTLKEISISYLILSALRIYFSPSSLDLQIDIASLSNLSVHITSHHGRKLIDWGGFRCPSYLCCLSTGCTCRACGCGHLDDGMPLGEGRAHRLRRVTNFERSFAVRFSSPSILLLHTRHSHFFLTSTQCRSISKSFVRPTTPRR